MEIVIKTLEDVAVIEDGAYKLKKADPETRAKQLAAYKDKREKELLKELRELEMLH